MKQPNIAIQRLLSEADRFKALAAHAALCALTNPPQREANELIARNHLLRADTYKAAAALIAAPSA
jgi:hypothetical protein